MQILADLEQIDLDGYIIRLLGRGVLGPIPNLQARSVEHRGVDDKHA